MSSCSIKWCGKNSKTSSYEKDGVTFHRVQCLKYGILGGRVRLALVRVLFFITRLPKEGQVFDHMFPKDPNIKDAWITACKKEKWFPSNYSVICSRHFTDDCFEHLKGNRRRLYTSAIPTLLLPHLMNVDEDSYPKTCYSSIIKKTLAANTTSNTEESSCPEIIEKTKNNKNVPPENNAEIDTQVSQAKKILCRKIAHFAVELKKSRNIVKRYKNKNIYLIKKCKALTDLLEKIKDNESITQDNIDIERLKTSNKQLRKKVVMLKRLLLEEKKKTISKRNVVWCPTAEKMESEASEEMCLKIDELNYPKSDTEVY